MLKEIIPQFLSTLVVFCSVIVVSQLVRLSNVLVTFGLTLENILLPFLYIIVPFLPIIIPISFLFGMMISFSRLSGDGELTAIMAAGTSLGRAWMPVLLLSVILYGVTAQCAIHLEAWGRREFVQFIYRKTQTEIDNMIRFKIQAGVFLKDFLDYVFYTESISDDRSEYRNVMLAPQSGGNSGDFMIMCPGARITGSVAMGDLRMVLYDGVSYSYNHESGQTTTLTFDRAEIDILRVFQEKILGDDTAKDDYRSYTVDELEKFVKGPPPVEDPKSSHLKASYLYYSRYANGFIIFAFAFFGMVLGIHEQRHAKNRGYLGSILTIIVCFVVMVGCRWVAEQALVPVLVAAWLPQILLFLAGAFCLFQKSRLPLSEPILAWRNMPFKKLFPKNPGRKER